MHGMQSQQLHFACMHHSRLHPCPPAASLLSCTTPARLPMMHNHLDRDGAPSGAPWAAITNSLYSLRQPRLHPAHAPHHFAHGTSAAASHAATMRCVELPSQPPCQQPRANNPPLPASLPALSCCAVLVTEACRTASPALLNSVVMLLAHLANSQQHLAELPDKAFKHLAKVSLWGWRLGVGGWGALLLFG